MFGHLQSDVATAAGLPAPLMPLFQFWSPACTGKKHGYTVGEISRSCTAATTIFAIFSPCLCPPLLIEIVVRLCYFAKRLSEGQSLADAMPFAFVRRTQTEIANDAVQRAPGIDGTGETRCKVALMQNPLSINYAQWLALFRYALPQVKWVVINREDAQMRFVQEALDNDRAEIDRELIVTWEQFLNTPLVL